MPNLPPLDCPSCGRTIRSQVPITSKFHSATTFQSCLRQCVTCGIGFSNAKTGDLSALTLIYRDPMTGLPEELHEYYETTLRNAINVRNRGPKYWKFHSSNSEDHATWTVFRFLQTRGMIREVLSSVGIETASMAQTEPSVLFWGVPLPPDDCVAMAVKERLIAKQRDVGENPLSYSEPDLILDFGSHGIVIFEVKLRSGNDSGDKKTPESGWCKYLTDDGAFNDPKGAHATGLYQLTRLWRLGSLLAQDRPFTLVNLAPLSLFNGKASNSLEAFERSLATGPSRAFMRLGWNRLLKAIPTPPDWLVKYDLARGVSSGMARLRRDLVSTISSQTPLRQALAELTKAHDYLVRQGSAALQKANDIEDPGRWGTAVKREKVLLPDDGKPGLIPQFVKEHNLVEVVNQCATLERLLDFLRWANRPGSEFTGFEVERCHPSTSSDKSDESSSDNDLMLIGPAGERANFEVSDVGSEFDSNRKLPKDLTSLRVLLKGEREQLSPAMKWPESRVFLIVSVEFAQGILRRRYSWISDGHFHFAEFPRLSEKTVLIEIRRGKKPEGTSGTAQCKSTKRD